MARAKQYSKDWPPANLDDAISRFAGNKPVISQTSKGKMIYKNTEAGIEVVEDVNGNYFGIYNSNINGKRQFLDLDVNIPNTKTLVNGTQTCRI